MAFLLFTPAMIQMTPTAHYQSDGTLAADNGHCHRQEQVRTPCRTRDTDIRGSSHLKTLPGSPHRIDRSLVMSKDTHTPITMCMVHSTAEHHVSHCGHNISMVGISHGSLLNV